MGRIHHFLLGYATEAMGRRGCLLCGGAGLDKVATGNHATTSIWQDAVILWAIVAEIQPNHLCRASVLARSPSGGSEVNGSSLSMASGLTACSRYNTRIPWWRQGPTRWQWAVVSRTHVGKGRYWI
ncbi:hypothetical protein E2562_030613 [Oryza meyeriana var. granulata]|uniref:Uncharacterized protein n=1 Tax=Oryza meyeriana var. granulata TaxID=110450 RepID=A0A6G1CI48_9ORYZ|nr:hypothetical protein E2562_030613 [Oryza meyeriana var. granulata]